MIHSVHYLLAAIFISSAFVACEKKTPEKQETSEEQKVNESLGEVTDMFARKLEGDGDDDIATDNDTLNRAIDAAREAELASTGQKAANHMVVRHWLTLMRDHTLKQAGQQALLAEATTFDNIKTEADIDNLTKKLNTYLEFNQGVLKKTQSGWMLELKSLADAEGMNPQHVEKAINNIAQSFSLIKNDLIIIRQKDHELGQVALKQHELLKKHLGSWKWDSIKFMPIFEQPAAQENFNQTHESIQKILKEQDDAQTRVLQIQQGAHP